VKVVFRVDASLQIGTGHVMRCLTLADALRERDGECMFICRSHEGHLAEMIRARGYDVTMLPEGNPVNAETDIPPAGDRAYYARWLGTGWETDMRQTQEVLAGTLAQPDWLVVDHYALDAKWERAMRPLCRYLMVIDDLADRMHDCELLLDQNLGRSATDYAGLVPSDCSVLVGPRYALLRPEFAALRTASLARRASSQVRHVLISMGGVDKDNATGMVLAALREEDLPINCKIIIVMGSHAPWLESVRNQASALPWHSEVMVNVSDMARLMAESDLAIGAAGSTSWERCCLGLPSILVVLAKNQWPLAQALHSSGGAVLLGEINSIISDLPRCMSQAYGSLNELRDRSSQIVTGEGADETVARMKGRHVC
jgi:UDP-2,4-diacetamido-2,4,6-trideoxy-beta-L-altropyranose hydrolase